MLEEAEQPQPQLPVQIMQSLMINPMPEIFPRCKNVGIIIHIQEHVQRKVKCVITVVNPIILPLSVEENQIKQGCPETKHIDQVKA